MVSTPIHPGFIADLLGKLEETGQDSEKILRELGLKAPVTRPLTTELFGHMWYLVARAMEDEFIGHGDRAMRPGSYALMCYAVIGTRNLEHAIKRSLAFMNAVIDAPRGHLVCNGDEAQILLDDTRNRSAFAYRTYWLILMGVSCWLIGRRIPLHHVEFTCPAPEDRKTYLQFFGAPVQFCGTRNRMSFAATYLRLPVIRDEAAVKPFLRKAPGNILGRFRTDLGVAGQVRSHLRRLPPSDWPDFARLADLFGHSETTLRRLLRADGQTYMAIKDELRLARAQALLDEGTMSIADIASHLGYSEASAFSRAHKVWTGRSPRGAQS